MDQRQSAFHESAHAVIDFALEMPIHQLSISRDSMGWKGSCQLFVPRILLPLHHTAIAALAGQFGYQLSFGPQEKWHMEKFKALNDSSRAKFISESQIYYDLQDATTVCTLMSTNLGFEISEHSYPSKEGFFEKCSAISSELVARYKQNISDLASELMQCSNNLNSSIKGEDVEAILLSHGLKSGEAKTEVDHKMFQFISDYQGDHGRAYDGQGVNTGAPQR